MGDRHRHVFVDDHVFDGNLVGVLDDLGAPLVAVLVLNVFELADDDFVNLPLVGENRPQLGDQLNRLAVLVHDLVAL
jgi:hypothetical protein